MPSNFFRTKSRLKLLAENNLGIVNDPGKRIFRGDNSFSGYYGKNQICRTEELDKLDQYYENTQYDSLVDWDEACAKSEDYVAVRKRKPRFIYPFAKVLTSRVASKLVGDSTFPKLKVEDDPDDTEYVRLVMEASEVKSRIMEPVRQMLAMGSSFVRFYIVESVIKMESYNSKYCYPVFDAAGQLESVEIMYVYEDEDDKDSMGNPIEKWYKLELGKMSDILYDNPPFKNGVEPEFVEVKRADHNLEFVQGEWLRTSEKVHGPDGYALTEDIFGFIDELNYNLSQSSQAVSYNQDPQLVLNKMDEEEIQNLIRSSQKGWNLGKEGEAKFLESGLEGVTVASDLRDKIRLSIQDIARVVLLDPDKAVASAQSGRAMEVLHGPLVELVNELRPVIKKSIINLVFKMSVAILRMRDLGSEILPIAMPDGWQPKSLVITATWPPIFPMTLEDLQKKMAIATSVAAGNLMSRESMTRWIAADFGIEDIEEELSKIDSQKILNPFGGGF